MPVIALRIGRLFVRFPGDGVGRRSADQSCSYGYTTKEDVGDNEYSRAGSGEAVIGCGSVGREGEPEHLGRGDRLLDKVRGSGECWTIRRISEMRRGVADVSGRFGGCFVGAAVAEEGCGVLDTFVGAVAGEQQVFDLGDVSFSECTFPEEDTPESLIVTVP